jgi:hypothetical protein
VDRLEELPVQAVGARQHLARFRPHPPIGEIIRHELTFGSAARRGRTREGQER